MFAGFGLFAPAKANVLTSLLVSALSGSAAIPLILALLGTDSSFELPLRGALTQLGD